MPVAKAVSPLSPQPIPAFSGLLAGVWVTVTPVTSSNRGDGLPPREPVAGCRHRPQPASNSDVILGHSAWSRRGGLRLSILTHKIAVVLWRRVLCGACCYSFSLIQERLCHAILDQAGARVVQFVRGGRHDATLRLPRRKLRLRTFRRHFMRKNPWI